MLKDKKISDSEHLPQRDKQPLAKEKQLLIRGKNHKNTNPQAE